MPNTVDFWSPKQEALTNAIKELQNVKEYLIIDKTFEDKYYILKKIDISINLIKGVIFNI